MFNNPSKYLRKAFFDALTGLVIDTISIPVFDERITGNIVPKHYILLSTQTKSQNKYTKCGDRWDCSILIDIITTYPATANTGSKLLVDNIEEAVINLENSIILGGGFKINDRQLVSSDSVPVIGTTTNVFRQLIRFQYFITQ